MLLYEYTLRATAAQQAAIDEAIRVVQFIRNRCLRLWMDGRRVGANDLQLACSRLAHEVAFVAPPSLNSQARQAAADRAWAAISRFSATCQAKRPGKKGYPTLPASSEIAARLTTRGRGGGWTRTAGT